MAVQDMQVKPDMLAQARGNGLSLAQVANTDLIDIFH